MICCLCLKEADNVIEIFGEEGRQLDIVTVLQKYFDNLELKSNDDDISKDICKDCWTTVSEFHEFCLVIEEAQLNWKNASSDNVFEPEVVMVKCESYAIDEVNNLHEELKIDIFKEQCPLSETTDSDCNNISPRRSRRLNGKSCEAGPDYQPKKRKTKPHLEKPPIVSGEEKKIEEQKEEEITVKKPIKIDEIDEKISEQMDLICDFCREEAPTFGWLRMHMQKFHQTKVYVRCCDKKFFDRTSLVEHLEVHSNPDHLRCHICEKSLSDRRCYEQHMQLKHASEDEKRYSCTKCPKRFVKRHLLERHQILHAERKHICKICEKGFPSLSQLKTHTKVKHLNYGIMCDICAKVLQGRAAFAIHMKEHQGIPIPKVQCSVCGSWHKNKHNLQKHMRKHDDEYTACTCNICGKEVINRHALLRHQRYVHERQRNHECTICKKCFKLPIALKEHMSLHTGEVLYNCPHCSRTFKSRANMYSHRKKAHRI